MAIRTPMAARAELPPLTPWPDFLADFRWEQGEHISFIGSTGGGKTTLAREILSRRTFVVACGTKPEDDSLIKLRTEGDFVLKRDFPFPPLEFAPHILFWPHATRVEDLAKHRAKFQHLFTSVYQDGGWTIYLDELRYFTDAKYLRLGSWAELFWLQGRSIGISLVAGTQRPAWVPLAAYSEPTHLFLWRNSDASNIRRLREIGGVNGREVQSILEQLPSHDVLYVNTRNGELIRTNTKGGN